MTYEALVTIVNLLTTIRPEYQELALINQLNNAFSFGHNIFLLHASSDINRFISATNQFNDATQIVYVIKKLGYVKEPVNPLRSKGKKELLIVVPESSNLESNLNLLRVVEQMYSINTNMKIGVFLPDTASSSDVQNLFEWLWNYGIINVFAAFYVNGVVIQKTNYNSPLNIFSFNPFGTFTVINVTGSRSVFPDRNFNFQQRPLNFAIPNIAKNVNAKPLESRDRYLWKSVCQVMNASFYEFLIDNLTDPFEGTRQIHISPYLREMNNYDIYPMYMESFVIVVPEAIPYPEFTAYLRTFATDIFFGYSLITVAIVVLLLTFSRYIKQQKITLFQCAADVLNLLMNDNGAIKYQQLSRSEFFLIIPLTLAGLIIVNGILSMLQSYLTRPIKQPQLETVEDLYKSPYRIVVYDEYWASQLIKVLQSISEHRDWSDKVRIEDILSVNYKMLTFDTSASFASFDSDAKKILQLQKIRNVKGYYITQIKIKSFWCSYHVHLFPFTERVNEIISWIRSAGLYDKWTRERTDRQSSITMFPVKREIDGDSFPVPMFIIGCYIGSVVVLIAEVVWYKFNLTTIISTITNRLLKSKLNDVLQ